MQQKRHRTDASQSCAKRWLAKFIRDEDGALIILSLQIFILMMVCTGIAIDFVRVEDRRAIIQNTLDRAALAAASLSQDLEPEAVIDDYLAKAGLDYLDVDTTVEEGNFKEWRRVTIRATDRMPTLFGPLMGINELYTAGNSQATESIGNVEISLVLDISGSMNFNIYHDDDSRWNGVYPTRMDQLRPAALNFVEQMFDTVQPASAPAGRLSISVVPYNQQVTLGSRVGSVFSLSTEHTQNTCADVFKLPTSQIAISPSTTLQRTMYGDSFDYWGNNFSLARTTSSGIMNCPNESFATVLAYGNDEQTIKDKISGLTPGGDTAIDVGARWGLALLDPAARPALASMISQGWASNDLAGRPLDYDDGTKDVDDTAMKVMVLMTDGQNTRSYSTKTAYRTGDSGFVSTRNSSAFSTNSTDWDNLYYYVPSYYKPYYRMRDGAWLYSWQMPSQKYNITWQTIWGKGYTLQGFIDQFGGRAAGAAYGMSKTAIYDTMAEQSEFSTKDSALISLCEAAKDEDRNIVIFTVAVDAPDAGKEVLSECATAETYAYEVDALDLTEAFASIASAINSLRLTN
ncbi:Flp pilus assembly protein TadG [Rhodobacter sp. JA431]|uniref:TadE/TadG family type IV pilus assembly protein n=1 Tax=Rhodobacter sp. JA431 TaxID=570013 RepID=UPI000BDBD2EC|nr:pilus assembly protein TadG-related protein [Rhodobacter sp. JA431]SOC10711.1 Flp pilus assembly protein TadG [Rhodobacter sp. JA431]